MMVGLFDKYIKFPDKPNLSYYPFMTKRKMSIAHLGLQKSLFHDLYYRVLRASWLKFFLFATIFYLLLNFIFACLYFITPAEIINARQDSLWDAFIFSFQTSSTLGYGHYLPKSDLAHGLVILDTMIGIFYVAIITGLAFAKFSRPSAKVIFSENIILTTFDHIPTLMFRLANNRDTHIVDASLNVAVLLPYVSKEGHEIRRFYKLPLMSSHNPTFSLSWSVIHQIDETSPLHGVDLQQMKDKDMLLFVSFTGIDDVLSQTIHANYRYASEKVVQAKKFQDILTVDENKNYTLDFSKFNEIID